MTQKDSQQDDTSGAARPPETQPCRPADNDDVAEPVESHATSLSRDDADELADASGCTDAASDDAPSKSDETELADLQRSDASSSLVAPEDAARDEPAEVVAGEKFGVSSFEDEAPAAGLESGVPDSEAADGIKPDGLPSSPVTMADAAVSDVQATKDSDRDDVAGGLGGSSPAEDGAPEASAVVTDPVGEELYADGGAELSTSAQEELDVSRAEPRDATEALPTAGDEATTSPPADVHVARVEPEHPAFDLPLDRVSHDTRVDHYETPQALDEPAGAEDHGASPDTEPRFDSGHELADADAADDTQGPIVVRTGWANPPPLTTQPSWVVRDVAPDIVRASEAALVEDTSGDDAPTVESQSDAAAAPEAEVDFAGWRQELLQSRPSSEPASPDLVPLAGEENDGQGLRSSEPAVPPISEPRALTQRGLDEREAPPVAARTDANWSVPAPSTSSPDVVWSPQQSPEPPLPPPIPLPVHAHAAVADVAYDDSAAPASSRWDRARGMGRTGLRYAGYAVAGYFAFVFALILLYRFVNPPFSSLMAVQALTGTSVQQEWVPLEDISPALVRAVIVSEDWSFCAHYGIDIKAIEEAIERSGNGFPRGASTISMQTTKNLFLWNAKSYIRKAVEVPLTLMIELIWPKWRILEIYLNVAEWGPGIFGAEAAAQYHFNKPASRLGEREAAQLAASLPNPIIREAGDPGPRTARKASVIQSRMRNAGGAANCVLSK